MVHKSRSIVKKKAKNYSGKLTGLFKISMYLWLNFKANNGKYPKTASKYLVCSFFGLIKKKFVSYLLLISVNGSYRLELDIKGDKGLRL